MVEAVAHVVAAEAVAHVVAAEAAAVGEAVAAEEASGVVVAVAAVPLGVRLGVMAGDDQCLRGPGLYVVLVLVIHNVLLHWWSCTISL